jgi:flagellar motor switch protein FliG
MPATEALPLPSETDALPAAETAAPKGGIESLTGTQRAAALLILLGVDAASKVLPLLNDADVEQVSVEIAKFRSVPSEIVDDLLLDFKDTALARDYVAQGGVSYAREVLESSLGPERAEDVMMRVEAAMEVSAFHLLQAVEIGQLTSFIEHEHPQTAALILAHLNPRKAAEILARLPEERQSEVVYRLATIGKTSPELLRDIEAVIRQQIGSVFGAEVSAVGGVGQVAEILNSTPRSAERSIMEALRERDGQLAGDIKALMFVFDDLLSVGDRDIQRILMEVDQQDIVLALKGAPDALKAKMLGNVSERVAQSIEEELELLGPVRVREVEEAQHRVLEKAQELEENEEISLGAGGQEQMI